MKLVSIAHVGTIAAWAVVLGWTGIILGALVLGIVHVWRKGGSE